MLRKEGWDKKEGMRLVPLLNTSSTSFQEENAEAGQPENHNANSQDYVKPPRVSLIWANKLKVLYTRLHCKIIKGLVWVTGMLAISACFPARLTTC